uniref:B30.2/SPRY domain-containing protein n=1 Tax=Trypanosoma congolense (strain IL3000) TaxID=1068625 RepID=G0UWU0_TRYCI|nr:conserved hypothetical protein [Trypanosoma congolense IL3000]
MKPIKSVTFEWTRADTSLVLNGPQVFHSGKVGPYRPVFGSLEMPPGEGKFFYEVITNDVACKLGVCVDDAFPADVDLQQVELGTISATGAPASRPTAASYCLFNCLTCVVEMDNVEVKRLWRSFIPVSGATLGFLVDTDEGTVQLYANGAYQGAIIDAASGFKGRKLRPFAALAGIHPCSVVSGGHRSSISVVPPRVIARKAVQ